MGERVRITEPFRCGWIGDDGEVGGCRLPECRSCFPAMTLLVCGSRGWKGKEVMRHFLSWAAEEWGVTHVVHGAAPGADTMAANWFKHWGYPVKPFKADWDDLTVPGAVIRTRRDGSQYNVVAGHQRNARMLRESNADVCLAFSAEPITSGTQNMVTLCLNAGVPTYHVTPAGKITQLDAEQRHPITPKALLEWGRSLPRSGVPKLDLDF